MPRLNWSITRRTRELVGSPDEPKSFPDNLSPISYLVKRLSRPSWSFTVFVLLRTHKKNTLKVSSSLFDFSWVAPHAFLLLFSFPSSLNSFPLKLCNTKLQNVRINPHRFPHRFHVFVSIWRDKFWRKRCYCDLTRSLSANQLLSAEIHVLDQKRRKGAKAVPYPRDLSSWTRVASRSNRIQVLPRIRSVIWYILQL